MVLPPQPAGHPEADVTESFIHKLQLSVSRGLPHAAPVPSRRTEEHELVTISLCRFFFLASVVSEIKSAQCSSTLNFCTPLAQSNKSRDCILTHSIKTHETCDYSATSGVAKQEKLISKKNKKSSYSKKKMLSYHNKMTTGQSWADRNETK
jgi:hypothetical protein